ncbi:geranylgeranylglycerol-phosphate geranylgeranyltransferase [Flavobacterium sp. N1719]|uniref:geranylgeranylglycerol-phosphate geranylgeranyltransferase n=1 Tax=Flavobacterium sp. N1719 TaxID=2885633 RepID=UPI0022232C96|nr:geranylgeranylglycerol-phosphate geranylgeranyltransferase [Flavobacterium sp. N1719]
MKFLQLIRYPNILALIGMLFVIRYGFLEQLSLYLALTPLEFLLFVTAVACIAAGGYIINDVFDQEVDAINRPNRVLIGSAISEANAYYWYGGLSITGVGIGMYLSNCIGRPGFGVFFVLVVALLYVYSSSLKQMPFVGNLVIGLLTGATIILEAIFDLYPITNASNNVAMSALFGMLKYYALFAVLLTVIREIIKDAEDREGDDALGMQTLPLVLGTQKTNILVAAIAVISAVLALYYCFTDLFNNSYFLIIGYLLFFTVAPLLFIAIRVLQAQTKADYAQLSKLMKFITLLGILALAVLTFNLKHHAG